MKSLLKVSIVAIIGLFVLTGCRTASIQNISEYPVAAPKSAKDSDMFDAIKRAGIGLGWQIKKVKDGQALGTLYLRDHMAVVVIDYTDKYFSITYKNSTNLKYDASKKTIHKNYNGWIQNLTNAIAVQYSAI
jgi:hypothetical protein